MFLPIKNLLAHNIATRHTPIAKQLEAHEIVAAMGPLLAKEIGNDWQQYVGVNFFQRGVLYLTVTTPLVKQEVRLRQQKIIDEINSQLAREQVREIRLIVGAIQSLRKEE